MVLTSEPGGGIQGMEEYSKISVATVGSESVFLDDLIFHLKTDLNQNVLESTIHEQLLKEASREMGIEVTDEALQLVSDEFLRKKGLHSAMETHQWLADNGLSIGEFERKMEGDIVLDEILNQVASDEAIRRVFIENITEFQCVKLGLIVTNSEGAAREIVSQLQEGEADFTELALKYSIRADVEKNGGYMGRAYRNDLPFEVDAKVFDEDASGLIGPIEVGGDFYIAKLYEKMQAELDGPARELCQRMLFDEFMQEKSQGLGVNVHILPDPPSSGAM